MCRLLLIKKLTDTQLPLTELLGQFAECCRSSKEDQGDGWGHAFLNPVGRWQEYKSLSPIWNDTSEHASIPQSKIVTVHARSATFDHQKGKIDFNQPFTDTEISFVSNVSIQGMKSGKDIPGISGAQKLFHLVQQNNSGDILQALERANDFVVNNANYIRGCNIGVADQHNIYASCRFGEDPEYFTLHYVTTSDFALISSERFGDYAWQSMQSGEYLKL